MMSKNIFVVSLFTVGILAFCIGWSVGRSNKVNHNQETFETLRLELEDKLAHQRKVLHENAREKHIDGDSSLVKTLDADLKELYERHKIRVRAAYREYGKEPPTWAMD